MLQHGLLHGRLVVANESKRDQAAIAVTLELEPFEPQWMSGDEGLQGGAAAIGDLDRRQPQLAAVGEQQRAAIAHNGDVGGADGGELAAILRCRIAHKERAHGGRRSDQKIAARSAFHDGGRLPEFATMPDEHSRHCDHRGGINVIAGQGTKSSRISAIGCGREPIDSERRPRPNHVARPHGEDCRALSARAVFDHEWLAVYLV